MAGYPELKLYIGGEWRTAAGAPVINPADESVLGTVPHATRADLDDALAAAEEGFRLLSQAGDPVDRGQPRILEPLDRIRASFWRLYEFSREQPQYFALMFVDRSVPRITREYDRFTFVRDMKSDIVGQMQECIDAGSLPSSVDPSVACRLLTMAVIGVAVMRLSDRLAPAENADDLASDVLNVTIAGLQAGVRLQSTGIECAADETSSPAKVF